MLATRLITLAPVTDLEDLSEAKESLSVPMLVSPHNNSPLLSVFVVSESLLPFCGLVLLLISLLGERVGDLFGLPSFPYRMPLCGTRGTSDLFRIHLVPHALHNTGASGGPRRHCGDSFGFMQCGFIQGPMGFSPRFRGDALLLFRGLATFFVGDRDAADTEGTQELS